MDALLQLRSKQVYRDKNSAGGITERRSSGCPAWNVARNALILVVAALFVAILVTPAIASPIGQGNEPPAGSRTTVMGSERTTIVMAQLSRFPMDTERPDDAPAEPQVVEPTRAPETLPESGAATSLWPIFIALFIVAGYLAFDTYRKDSIVK